MFSRALFLCPPYNWYILPSMKRCIQFALLAVFSALLAGCGAAESMPSSFDTAAESFVQSAAPAAMMAEPEMLQETTVEREVFKESAAQPTSVPVPASAPAAAAPAGDGFIPSFDEVQASVSAQNRIIVRTVGMDLVVDNVADKVDRIASLAQELGGWAVSSDRSAIHRGQVSVRVPAQQLDDAVRKIRSLAIRVEAESSTSQDVTDEYVDTSSRLRSLRATEESLLDLLAQATDVEDALDVQRELVNLQSEIESLEGRIKFLQQTAAFSLINIDLSLAPRSMTVNAGPDRTFSTGQVARFRATFMPPEGIDDFQFTWDFGDGSTLSGSGSAPTTQPGQRVTATVNHVFGDDSDSPYIVQLEMTGTGPAGLVEGSDTLIATVSKIPSIEVFAGEDRTVEEGEEVEYGGSFTRPEGLWDMQYRWDLGDGSPTVIGTPDDNATRATVLHTYENYRPHPYEVILTVTAQSEAGEVKGTGSFFVFVRESQGLIVGGWDLAGSAKTAVRALSAVALGLSNVLIWLAIFSPVWLALAAAAYGLYRLARRRRQRRTADRPNSRTETTPGQDAASNVREPEEGERGGQ